MIRSLAVLLMCSMLVGYADAQQKRAMTFMDVMNMRSAQGGAISPDGQEFLYVLSVPDWKKAKPFTDIWLVDVEQGPKSSRQMTFTADKNETGPVWTKDGKRFLFLSSRESPEGKTYNQIYLMRIDGGEARKVTQAKEGIGSFALSRDGRWLAYTAGKEEERQLWIVSVDSLESGKPAQVTKKKTPISWWAFSPESSSLLFTTPDSVDAANKKRKDQKFDVRVRNEMTAPSHLWEVDIATKQEKRLTGDDAYSVGSVTMSKDGKWIGFSGTVNDRFTRTITESGNHADLYLLERSTGSIERLTNNTEIDESSLSFSPDNATIAFSADEDFTYFRAQRVYVRKTADRNAPFRKIGSGFDIDVSVGFWSDDGSTIYFNEGYKATSQVFALNVATGVVRQATNERGVVYASYNDETKKILITSSSPTEPNEYYTVDRIDRIGRRGSWKRLTDANPHVRDIALGETEAVQWTSTDGTVVEGILVKPVGAQPGKRYPLILQIHGGPAGAVTLSFNAGYGYYSHVFAGVGFACLLPNYRGSSNYGEKFRMQIGGDYFRQGYEDIMAGVDHVIAQGVADSARLGVMGWSAGGHWSNWILTHTDRFKAISSGAGAVNWTSMYAQSDIQRNREFYFGGKPYDNFEKFWDVSPLKYIRDAKTPTLIHVVDGDPRVPRPQSDELHMALRQLGIPTEYFVYPGSSHGIPDMRNQLVKMVSEFRWMEKWILGRDRWFEWNELISTLGDEKEEKSSEKD